MLLPVTTAASQQFYIDFLWSVRAKIRADTKLIAILHYLNTFLKMTNTPKIY